MSRDYSDFDIREIAICCRKKHLDEFGTVDARISTNWTDYPRCTLKKPDEYKLAGSLSLNEAQFQGD